MTCVIIGEILDFKGNTILIKDSITGEIHDTTSHDDETFELKKGDSGIFIGNFEKGIPVINRYELKKFLDPMYEEDIIEMSGKIIVELINDPFPKIYAEKEAQQAIIDLANQ